MSWDYQPINESVKLPAVRVAGTSTFPLPTRDAQSDTILLISSTGLPGFLLTSVFDLASQKSIPKSNQHPPKLLKSKKIVD